ncbi:MAG: hypothetical protein ACFFCZ_30760 [Promethearchaeota archaeon]
MSLNIIWLTTLAVVIASGIVILATIIFFLRRIKNMRQWQDIYLTLTYIISGCGLIIPGLADLLFIPLFGNTPETQAILLALWRGYLLTNFLYLLPLAAFAKMTFRSNSRIATVFLYILMFLGGITSAFILIDLRFSLFWDETTWILLYEYENLLSISYIGLLIFLTIPWFSYEALRLYISERRKKNPNPIQLRRFMLLMLSGITLLVTLIMSMTVLGAYGDPSAVDPLLALFFYTQPILLTDAFVIFSSLGWIMPSFVKRGVDTKKINPKTESGGM